jgi:iron complex transport system ATP-binding protein
MFVFVEDAAQAVSSAYIEAPPVHQSPPGRMSFSAGARLTDRAGQSWHTLSGGERQRTQIARALAQEPRELLLDEPTNHLDIQHQLDLLDLIAALPVTTVVALHDLNLAAMYCDRLLVLRDGRAVTEGTPAEVLTPALIEQVYGVRAEVTHDPGHPVIRFLRPAARDESPPKRSVTSNASTAP